MAVKKHAKVSIGNWPYGGWSSCTDSLIPLPGLVAVVTLSLGVIGYDKNIASWCWIDPDTPAILFWQFFTGKAWEMSTYLLTIIMYSVVRGFLFKHVSRRLVHAVSDLVLWSLGIGLGHPLFFVRSAQTMSSGNIHFHIRSFLGIATTQAPDVIYFTHYKRYALT